MCHLSVKDSVSEQVKEENPGLNLWTQVLLQIPVKIEETVVSIRIVACD